MEAGVSEPKARGKRQQQAEPERLADTLHGKISEVQRELGVMPKDRHVEVRKNGQFQYAYDYLSESALMNAVRERLALRGVAVYVSTDSQRREGNLTMVETSITFADGKTGETFTIKGQGQGADPSDKGVYKAITGANRYMLWKTFLIPTEGDDPNQPHEVDAEPTDAPVTVTDALARISLFCADGRPWLKEAVETFYAEVETFPERFGALPDRVRIDVLRKLQTVVRELEANPKFDPLKDPEQTQLLMRVAFSKAFGGVEIKGPEPFDPAIPF